MSLTAEEQGYVTRLERRLQALEERVGPYMTQLDIMRTSGLNDLLTGHGYQRYGAGNMRTHLTGQQILVPDSNTDIYTIYWTPEFFSSTPPAGRGATLFSKRNANDAYLQLRTTSDISDSTPSTYALLELDAWDDAGGAYAITQVLFNSNLAKIEVTSDGAGIYAYISPAMRLASQASDPVTLSDGLVWYRSDTDKFRGRANSATDNFAMEAWVTANASTGGGWVALPT